MGADGGSVAKRSELVSTLDPLSTKVQLEGGNHDRWIRCALTGEQLADPIVSDWNGDLYNKTAILRYLLGELPTNLKPKTSINQIRDVVELKRDFSNGKWIDMVSKKILADEGMSEGFGYMAECGHIAPSLLLSKHSSCPICSHEYEDYIIINPQTSDGRAHNTRRIETLESLGLSHSLRPKKRKGIKRGRGGESTEKEYSNITKVRTK